LHNTLGAWWAGKLLAADPALARDAANEDALRAACALPGYAWDYLRFVKEGETWRPAAGSFPGWPQRAAELTVLDPCCGSGHFLTEALSALAALRAREEGLTPANAVAAVLRDNLAGLEIDGRCVQIASFALALTAWRIGVSIGIQKGPPIGVQKGPLSRRRRNDIGQAEAGGSVAAKAARRDDCLEFSEIKVADRLQRLCEGAVLQVLGQRFEPGGILRL